MFANSALVYYYNDTHEYTVGIMHVLGEEKREKTKAMLKLWYPNINNMIQVLELPTNAFDSHKWLPTPTTPCCHYNSDLT